MERQRIEGTEMEIFVGNWKTNGRMFETNENPEMEIIGTDTYELILDGFFLLHKADVLMGNEKSKTFEIIWLNHDDDQASLQHYNNAGSLGLMSGRLKLREWMISGEELRFHGKFNENYDQLSGRWQKLDSQKKWVNFIEIQLNRIL
jgi:hypothetical protein